MNFTLQLLRFVFFLLFLQILVLANMKTRYPFLDIDIDVPKDKADALQAIQSWLSFQPHLPSLNGEFLQIKLLQLLFHEQFTKLSRIWLVLLSYHNVSRLTFRIAFLCKFCYGVNKTDYGPLKHDFQDSQITSGLLVASDEDSLLEAFF